MATHWYRDAIIYSLDVETYQDSNGDGTGDFRGLTHRLDHLDSLGITCIWLLPFFPSPNRDNGYDILDYYDVASSLGSLGDFVEFTRKAREKGIRVLIDLVVNHTSDQHPWFQEARDPASEKHDWYVWREEKPEEPERPVIFKEDSASIWTYDEKAEKYYLHRFYKHQPDLNIANPRVRKEIRKIMAFWLKLGVSGFRVDAAPYLFELKGVRERTDVDSSYEYLRRFRDFVQSRKGDAILLAEANVSSEKIGAYFKHGVHLLFNFLLNQHLFLALARKDSAPLKRGFHWPDVLPEQGQWANFLRNHDELNLNRLSDEEREEVFRVFAPEENMRIFGRGIRRRLTPLFGGNERRIRMAYSLMFSLPGTPVLRYGQEIGMGDDLSLPGRRSVRTAMQWSNEPNGGFSTAPSSELARPAVEEGPYGYHHVNVRQQRRNPNSRLNWMGRIIKRRKENREPGHGKWIILETGLSSVFAHASQRQGSTLITVHNLSDEACTAELDLGQLPDGQLIDLLGDKQYEPLDTEERSVDLRGYGYRWFHLKPKT